MARIEALALKGIATPSRHRKAEAPFGALAQDEILPIDPFDAKDRQIRGNISHVNSARWGLRNIAASLPNLTD